MRTAVPPGFAVTRVLKIEKYKQHITGSFKFKIVLVQLNYQYLDLYGE
jgi:hypothetical protein